MATFEARAYTLTIEPHPNADRIEIARVQGYQMIVPKGQYRTGDTGVFLPPNALVPEDVIEELGLTGKLAGKASNRIKPVRLRGVLSEGLVYPVDGKRLKNIHVAPDDLLTQTMGIEKYEPPIPASMGGEVENRVGETIGYDIEAWKRFPEWFTEGEPVVITEKIHGTLICMARIAGDPDRDLVTSKGRAARGLAMKRDVPANRTNIYVRAYHEHRQLLDHVCQTLPESGGTVHLFGEIYGSNVQDLSYGLEGGKQKMAIFDIHIGPRYEGRYLNAHELRALADTITMVPVLYEGPYSAEVVHAHTEGRTTLGAKHMREGIVIRPLIERRTETGDRVLLKNVSGEYLTRANATEYV